MRQSHAVLAGILAFVLVTLASAGVFSPPDAPQDVEPEVTAASFSGALPAALVESGLDAPEWRIGDAWLVRFNSGFSCWLVVGERSADGYAQGTSCDGDLLAGAQLAANEFPYAGDFDRDLSYTPGDGEPTRYYDWPLADGKTWETHWFGDPVTVEANYVEALESPLGREPGFRFQMRYASGDALIVEYDYVPSLRWWSHFTYANGAGIAVEDAVRGWNGRVVMMEAEERARISANLVTAGETHDFEVARDDDALIVETRWSNRQWLEMRVRDPSGTERARESRVDLTVEATYAFSYVEDLEPGTWTAEAQFAGLGVFETRIHALHVDILDL